MRPLHILFAVMVAILWGANFIAAKYSVAYFPSFYLTGLRFLLVTAVMLPFVPLPTLAQLRATLLIAFLSAIQFALLFAALQHGLDIASTAIVGQLGVPFACVLGVMFLGDKIGLWRSSGIVVALIGTFIVAGTPNVLSNLPAFYIALGSTFTWGLVNILIKKVQGMGSLQLLAYTSLLIVPMVFAMSLLLEPEPWPPLLSAPLPALFGVVYTAIASTVVAYGLWYFLLTRYTVSQVTPFSLLTPVFGIAFGQMFFAEELTAQTLIGGALTILGVAVIVIRRPKTLAQGSAT